MKTGHAEKIGFGNGQMLNPPAGRAIPRPRSQSGIAVSLVIVVCFILSLAICSYLIHKHLEASKKKALIANEAEAAMLAGFVAFHEKTVADWLKSFTRRQAFIHAIRKKDAGALRNHLADLMRNRTIDLLWLTDTRGILRANYPDTPKDIGRNLSDSDWYRGVSIQWRPYVSNVIRTGTADPPHAVAVSVPVLDGGGAPIGILCGIHRLTFLADFIRNATLTIEADMTVIDREGHILHGTSGTYRHAIETYRGFQTIARSLQTQQRHIIMKDRGRYFGDRYISVVPVDGTDWSVIAERRLIDIIRAERQHFIEISLIVFILFLTFSFLLIYARKQFLHRSEKESLQSQLQLQISEQRYKALFDNMSAGLIYGQMIFEAGKPVDFTCLEINKSFETLTGLTNVIGKKGSEILPGIREMDQELLETGGRVSLSQNPERLEIYVKAIQMWFSVSVYSPREKHFIAIFDAITERKKAEENINKANRILAVMSQINDMVMRTRNADTLFIEACRIVIEYGKFRMAWIGLISEADQSLRPIVWAGFEDGYLSQIKKISVTDIPEGRGPSGTAIREGMHVYCNDIENDPRMAVWRDEAVRRGYRSSIALPIRLYGQVIGAFNIYASEPFFFNESEIGMLHEITGNIGYALEMIDNEKKRRAAEDRIRIMNEELEDHVRKRTEELAAKNAELERLNRVFVDRELRMRELKSRIAELEKNPS